MDAIITFIQPYVTPALVVVCFMVGWLLKNTWETFDNRFIPLILMPIGIVGAMWMNGWAVTPETVYAGMCSAALAVWAHSTGKHISEFIVEKKN